MKDASLSDLLIQVNINTDNQLMFLCDSSWQDCQTLAKVQNHKLYLTKDGQLTMAHMLQNQLLNKVQKASIMQNALQDLIYHISGCYFMNCLTRIHI